MGFCGIYIIHPSAAPNEVESRAGPDGALGLSSALWGSFPKNKRHTMKKQLLQYPVEHVQAGRIRSGLILAFAFGILSATASCTWSPGPDAPAHLRTPDLSPPPPASLPVQGLPENPQYTYHENVFELPKNIPVTVYESSDDMPEDLRRIMDSPGVEVRNGRPISQRTDERLVSNCKIIHHKVFFIFPRKKEAIQRFEREQ